MPEIMFVLKGLIVALVITMLMQIQIGNSTIETHAHLWIESASVPGYVHQVSSGAVLAIRNATKATTDFVSKSMGHESGSQKADRVNLGFKRNAKYEEKHRQNDSDED